MDANKFVDTAKDSREWIVEALRLRQDANLLWDRAERLVRYSLTDADQDRTTLPDGTHWSREQAACSERAVRLMKTSLLLLALSVENALKGKIISEQPKSVTIEVTLDGEGTPKSAELTKIGGSQINHELHKLAGIAGILEREDLPVENDCLKSLLEELKHSLEWAGRYPVPLKTASAEKLGEIHEEIEDVTVHYEAIREVAHYVLEIARSELDEEPVDVTTPIGMEI